MLPTPSSWARSCCWSASPAITLLLLAQNYRAARTSLSRITAFSDHVVDHMPIGLVATDSGERIAAFNEVAESRAAASPPPPRRESRLRRSCRRASVAAPGERNDADRRRAEVDCTWRTAGSTARDRCRQTHRRNRSPPRPHFALQRPPGDPHPAQRNCAQPAPGHRRPPGRRRGARNPQPAQLDQGVCHVFPERYRENAQDANVATILIQEVDRLNRVVSQLLEFSRPIGIFPGPSACRALVGGCCALIEPQAPEKAVTIETTFDAGTTRRSTPTG